MTAAVASDTVDGNVFGGVDSHADTIHVAVISDNGGHLADAEFATTAPGYAAAPAFLAAHGQVVAIGVEGTASYGAGFTRAARAHGFRVVEVNRPDRAERRRTGKSDPIDAYAAARAALSGRASSAPKDDTVAGIRALHNAARSAVKARTGVLTALKSLARRVMDLTAEHDALTRALNTEVTTANPGLRAAYGVGPDTAAQLLITAGDNPERMRTEASFAALCGAAPVPASSGRTNRHRLSRGGDRAANAALYRIAPTRMAGDPRTREHVSRHTTAGRTKKEIIRLLKRAITREIFRCLSTTVTTPGIADLLPCDGPRTSHSPPPPSTSAPGRPPSPGSRRAPAATTTSSTPTANGSKPLDSHRSINAPAAESRRGLRDPLGPPPAPARADFRRSRIGDDIERALSQRTAPQQAANSSQLRRRSLY